MLVGAVVAAVVLVGVVAGVVLLRRSQDDVHSVEHYHRQLHTLEELRTHPGVGHEEAAGGNGESGESGESGEAAYPASAFRVSSSSNVRLTEPGTTIVPPVPPPAVPNPGKPFRFDDGPTESGGEPAPVDGEERPASAPSSFMTGVDDPAMHSINHRPRRLGGPLAAIGAVVVLVIVLIVAGLHSNAPPKHHGGHATDTTVTTAHAGSHTGSHPGTHSGTHSGSTSHGQGSSHRTTTTTAAPAVSAPANASAHTATYQVADASYSLALAANTGECWVEATQTSTGKVLYTGTLFSGQSQTVAASGSVSVIAGAPGAFSATINGAAVVLPPGAQAPFTLTFQPPGGTGNTGASGGASGTAGNTGAASG